MKDYSGYHQTNSNIKIEKNGLEILEHSLRGFEGYDVIINDTRQTKVLMYQKYDAENTCKKIIGKVEDIELGNLLFFNNLNWLVTTFPEDNKIYRKAEIKLCNATFPIKSSKTKILKGYNKYGKPLYDDIYDVNKFSPCIVESKNTNPNNDNQLSISENQLLITLQYQESDTLVLNYEFEMYGERYKIINIDYTKVISDIGILKLIAERV
ncbi:hypothetical protein NST17_19795 [Caldifermentibacillus hisashii]|uniref:Uncharacterized protein n=1 Tax=Caldifermentibacillus hisashii TaxID=996558 RepID=A0ABU9K2M7_9BACI